MIKLYAFLVLENDLTNLYYITFKDKYMFLLCKTKLIHFIWIYQKNLKKVMLIEYASKLFM